MNTLAIDAATNTATVALFRGDALAGEEQTTMRGVERETLLPAVENTLRAAGVGLPDIDRLICGAGPGSFTSLRVAASLVKGIAFGRSVRVDAVPSLALIVVGGGPHVDEGRYVACLDALRGQHYVAGYSVDDGGQLSEFLPLRLVSNAEIAELADSVQAIPVGPDQRRAMAPHARGALRASAVTTRNVDVATWEPAYGRKAEAEARWEAAHGRPLSGD